jgi:hypothetical protein
MIAALLLRYGIPSWAAKLAGIAALVLGLWAALAWHDHRVFAQGVAQEKSRRDVLDAASSAQAEAERLRLDRLVAQAQAQLDAARARVDQLQAEVDHEKTISTDRQQRLLAGTERERVLIRAIPGPSQAGAGGQAASATAGAVDSGSGASSATLDPRVASDLEWVRATRNTALDGLQACIIRYDALKTAVDATP